MSSIFKYKIISSSSKANSYAVELPGYGLTAIECGVIPSTFVSRAGIPACYWFSHWHEDHSKYERLYKKMCYNVKFANEFSLEHGTSKKPCDNKGFYIDFAGERFLFATDFYGFDPIENKRAMFGVAMVECSHDFPLYKKFSESDDKLQNMKALMWENHACEHQTVALLQHFLEPNYQGEIILLHRSVQAYDTMGYSELYVRNKFPLAQVKWAENLTK